MMIVSNLVKATYNVTKSSMHPPSLSSFFFHVKLNYFLIRHPIIIITKYKSICSKIIQIKLEEQTKKKKNNYTNNLASLFIWENFFICKNQITGKLISQQIA